MKHMKAPLRNAVFNPEGRRKSHAMKGHTGRNTMGPQFSKRSRSASVVPK
jgi:hypothetical protein